MGSQAEGVLYSPGASIQGLGPSELAHRLGLLSLYTVSVIVGFFVIRSVYYLWFHPLAKYPGPWYAACTSLVFYGTGVMGTREHWTLKQHQKYGEVFRIAPGRLSFSSAQAWKDIYGHRTANKQKEMLKDPLFYDLTKSFGSPGDAMIGNIDSETHGKMRKIFTNAFSDRALREQEPLLFKYVNKLIARIGAEVAQQPSQPLDLVRLYNCTTFDIMADLTFGESLGMLDNGSYTPWVAKIFGSIKFQALLHIVGRWVWLRELVGHILPPKVRADLDAHRAYVVERVDRRMAKQTEQPDIWNLVLRKPENLELLTKPNMDEHANLFMAAGTETTATLLSGMTYYLLKNREKFDRVVAEVRSLPEESLHIDALRQLPYLQACFEEGLRMYPPVPLGLPRVVPEGGAAVSGSFVPEGTRVSTHQLSTYRNELNFKNPFEFAPERWLPEYADVYGNDRKEALQPFSTGPRNCIGKNLAYHEMRLIFSKIVWNFDLELAPESANWADQKIYILWEKHPLMVKATPRKF